ncbi:MAG TPA: TonB family protein [Acidobacteriaceae bacterium]|nr:TonB family protein [Acidobacteriaceae bacterium]
MFEGSLVESRGLVVSRSQRWSTLGSAALQLLLAALIVAIPMLRPQTMKIFTSPPQLTAPLMRTPPPQQPVHVVTSSAPSSGPGAPSQPAQMPSGIRHFSLQPGMPGDDLPPGPIGSIVMDGGPNPMASLGPAGSSPAITVTHPEHRGPVSVSGGVTTGMLLAPIRPVYPPIARAAGIQGTVVISAIISKAGAIESAHAVSGPAMLRQAALDAVVRAHYRPYLLSGQPVEVETTVTVMFTLGQ